MQKGSGMKGAAEDTVVNMAGENGSLEQKDWHASLADILYRRLIGVHRAEEPHRNEN